MNNKIQKLGTLEMEIIGILTQNQPLTVHEVQHKLKASQKKELAYTTVMTVLSRLTEKGLLERKKQGRQYLYTRTDNSTIVSESILNKMSRTLFKGKQLIPILNLLDNSTDLTTEELTELKNIIDQKIKSTKKKT